MNMPPMEVVPELNTDSSLIDTCIKYVEDKDGHYLAREGKFVFYASDTGRRIDYKWHKQSMTETLRIIKATRLKPNLDLKDHHLLSAMQELGKVYEYGVKSPHKVREGVFNYTGNSKNAGLGDLIMARMVEELHRMNHHALLLRSCMDLFNMIQCQLEAGVKPGEARELLFKHFEGTGYVIKTGVQRPLVNGKRAPVIMMPGTKPKDVTGIYHSIELMIVEKITKELE